MTDVVFNAFKKQSPVLLAKERFIGAFAGKRGGKTEIGAVWGIKEQETRPNYKSNGIDPFLGVIVAPTNDMLGRLSWKKFMAYAKRSGMIKKDLQNPKVIEWHDSVDGDESLIYGISGDRPERIEGIKANWIWIDEVFQIKEQLFLECLARVSDTGGRILCTGSLGVQFINPKQHWAYRYFKNEIDEQFKCFEWGTVDNPHYPKEEIERNKKLLDRQTFKAMFEICWDIIPQNAVYSEFSDDNIIQNLQYNPDFKTICVVDWGWAHPMACGIFQYDIKNDIVYLIDEIVKSKLKLEKLLEWIQTRPYKINDFYCDIAGNQEREQTGISNVRWFKLKGNINFKYKKSRILHGITIVRSYICNANGVRRFFVNSNCSESIDGLKRYKYAEKDGVLLNENPLKENDDAADMVRYYFVNNHDNLRKGINLKPFTGKR